jgi:hypothetical protein
MIMAWQVWLFRAYVVLVVVVVVAHVLVAFIYASSAPNMSPAGTFPLCFPKLKPSVSCQNLRRDVPSSDELPSPFTSSSLPFPARGAGA